MQDAECVCDFNLGQRYYIGGDIGTIRFVGYLQDVWGPHELALGIEWDRPGRGSNDGSLDGKFYFHVKAIKSGSFIKARNRTISRHRLYFDESLIDRYADTTQFTTCLSFGSKIVQGKGFDKLNRIHSDFSNMHSIILERQGIFACSRGEDRSVTFSELKNVVHLDLSFNLFSSLTSVWEIVDNIPSLESLVLDGNRFDELLGPPVKTHPLKVLKMDGTLLSVPSINIILEKFPNLHELLLGGNDLGDEDLASLCIPASVRILGLSRNQLTKTPLLGNLRLKELDLSHNRITTYIESIHESVESLDLRNNSFDDWKFIIHLPYIFPNLKELRINHNPLFASMLVEDMTVSLVGHLPCRAIRDVGAARGIEKMNGGVFRADEVRNYELYFISTVEKGLWTKPLAIRWSTLLSKYDKSVVSITPPQPSQGMRAKILSLRLNAGSIVYPRFLMGETTILRLRGIFSKLLGNISVLDLSLYYYLDDVAVNDEEKNKKLCLQDNMARLSSYGLRPDHNIYCEVSCK